MLHSHDDISFLPEIHFLRKYLALPFSYWSYVTAGVHVFRRILNTDEQFERVGIPIEEVLAPFMKGARSFDPVEVYTRLLRLYCIKEDVKIVGVKDPRLIDYLPSLKQLFPQARILHIVRDPRDVVLSRMNVNWSSGRPAWMHVFTYRAQVTRGREHGGMSFGEQYMEVRYEDLIMEPEATLRTIAKHVGLEYSDDMLAFQKSAEDLVHENERAWKEETTGPLLRDNMNKWQDGLSDCQIVLTEKVCSKAFDWFGYERVQQQLGRRRTQWILLQLAPVMGKGFEYAYSVVSRFR